MYKRLNLRIIGLVVAMLLSSCGRPSASRLAEANYQDKPLTVISDIDDTLRMTAVKHPGFLIKGLFKRRHYTFLHFNTVLASLKDSFETVDYNYVTASPKIPVFNLFKIVSSTVRNDGFPKGRFFGRPLKERDIFEYKVARHRQIIDESSKDSVFLLLGDDTQKDRKVFEKLQDIYPSKDIRFLIHMVNNEEGNLSSGDYFLTAGDLAYQLWRQQLISTEALRSLNESQEQSISEGQVKRIIPRWVKCRGFAKAWKNMSSRLFDVLNERFASTTGLLKERCGI